MKLENSYNAELHSKQLIDLPHLEFLNQRQFYESRVYAQSLEERDKESFEIQCP